MPSPATTVPMPVAVAPSHEDNPVDTPDLQVPEIPLPDHNRAGPPGHDKAKGHEKAKG
jgi:hypothetical protein